MLRWTHVMRNSLSAMSVPRSMCVTVVATVGDAVIDHEQRDQHEKYKTLGHGGT